MNYLKIRTLRIGSEITLRSEIQLIPNAEIKKYQPARIITIRIYFNWLFFSWITVVEWKGKQNK